ncbi:MAG: hypothetical protein ABI411_04520 [Tahibacter sp.]
MQQHALTNWLIDQLTREMKGFVSQPANMRLIDSRGALARKQQWENEIHPTRAGFALIAERCWVPALNGLLA